MATPLHIAIPQRLKSASLPAPGGTPPRNDATQHGAGFDAGYKEGRWRAELELRREREALRSQFQDRLSALGQIHENLLKLSQQHLPSLVLAATTRLLAHHRFTDEEIFNEVGALIGELGQASQVSVECNPQDLEALLSRVGELGLSGMNTTVAWKPNPSLRNGEFILTSDLGCIDGRRVSRLHQLRLALEL